MNMMKMILIGLSAGGFDLVGMSMIIIFFLSLLNMTGGVQEDIYMLSMTSEILIILSVWLLILMLMINYDPKSVRMFYCLLVFMNLMLILCFKVQNLLGYYFFFESILIPIYMLILGWGYQPERLVAATMMFFYTLFASLPLLVMIVYLGKYFGSLSFLMVKLMNVSYWNLSEILFIGAFLVKFPIYSMHLWLPKAHVEAPVSGSMILAGVLLKLGGYGMMIVGLFGLGCGGLGSFFNVLSLMGGSLVSFMILTLLDMKVAIAYSSVVHMAPVIAGLLGSSFMGLLGAVLMMLAHGLTSSGMFGGAFILYLRSHSRSLVSNKGVVGIIPSFSMIWFLLIVLNFAGPFTLNLFSEIMLIGSIMSVSMVMMVYVGMLCFFSAAYNLNLFASSQQGMNINSVGLMVSLLVREKLSLFLHIIPCIIVLLSMIF